MSTPEGFVPLNGSAGNSAPVAGGKRGSRKLKLVTRKQARKILKKMGRKMRGGAGTDVVGVATPAATPASATGTATGTEEGGRRRKGTKKTHRRSRGRSLFGMKY